MIYLLAFLGGVLTIVSPCILPVIPLAFARAERGFMRETLPMLAGLAIAFAAAAAVTTAAAHWLIVASELGRVVALAMLAGVGFTLLSATLAERVTRSLATLGARLTGRAQARSSLGNVAVGAAIGLLWAPCAGPILGLVIAAGAATDRAHAISLFLTFSLGAAMSIAIVLSAGTRVLGALRRAGAADVVIRRTLGVATLATVAVLALGWDAALFAKAGLVQTASAEEVLVRKLVPERARKPEAGMSLDEFAAVNARPSLQSMKGQLPGFSGATEWINSPALTPESLRGKVVLVEFWTFACYNCLNALPHVKELYAKYKDRGLIVIGVHTPELPHEYVLSNVREQVKKLGITYPVVVDNDYRIWKAFQNQYWPAAYYADATGKLRFYHFGEGRYDEQEQVVEKLLAEAGK